MSDDSEWMPPGAGAPIPVPPTGETPPPLPPPPYLPPAEPVVPGPPSSTVPAMPPSAAPAVDVEPTAAPRRRGKAALIGAVLGVVAIGAAGTFAVAQLAGDDDGGAASAEDLGHEVLASIEDEDVLGLLDVLIPAERELFRQPAIDFVSELERLEILGPTADLAKIEGVDLSVTNGGVVVRQTNVPDISNLELTGEITAEVDGEQLPIGDVILDNAPDADVSDLDASDTTDLELPLTAVEVDDRWYLSVFHTIAELARQDLEPVPDIPDSGVVPSGGETPEDALDALVEAFEGLDLEALVAAINPGDAAALQRYAPLFLADAQADLDELPVQLDVTEAEYTVTGDGSRRHASIDVLAVEGTADGTAFEVEYADGCVRFTAEGEEVDTCELDGPLAGELDQYGDVFSEGPVRDLIDVVTEAFADYDQPGITLVRTDGEWFVSPIGTASDQMLAVLRALDRSEVDELIAAVPPAVEVFLETIFGSMPLDDDQFIDDLIDDPFTDDSVPGAVPPVDEPDDTTPGTAPVESAPADTGPGTSVGETVPVDTTPVDTTPVDSTPVDTFPESLLTRCWDMLDASEASTCFQEVVGAGEAQYWEVPIEMLHPECGVADAYWGGYAISDAEFFELVDGARPCFLGLVESGDYLESDLPVEYTKPECFEGRNWYQVLDDPDYDQRVLDCKYG